MPRGAKTGENRFKRAQTDLVNFRLSRLRDVVLPQVKALSAHTEVSSINRFCLLCSEIYNRELPLNEKPISYRRINQSSKYWGIVGPVYYKYFEGKKGLEDFRKQSKHSLAEHKLKLTLENIERYEKEIRSLKFMISNGAHELARDNSIEKDLNLSLKDVDNMGRIIQVLIDKIGVIEVSEQDSALRDLSDDLEPKEGMLPSSVVESYIRWLNNKGKKLRGIHD